MKTFIYLNDSNEKSKKKLKYKRKLTTVNLHVFFKTQNLLKRLIMQKMLNKQLNCDLKVQNILNNYNEFEDQFIQFFYYVTVSLVNLNNINIHNLLSTEDQKNLCVYID